jgi:hypothetical protein
VVAVFTLLYNYHSCEELVVNPSRIEVNGLTYVIKLLVVYYKKVNFRLKSFGFDIRKRFADR